jgi:hypothetical protein
MERLKELWCEVMHDSLMWPIHEHYECRSCGRRSTVPWTSDTGSQSRTDLRIFTGDGQLAPAARR